jgi:putative hydrolase of the HAD superfamily
MFDMGGVAVEVESDRLVHQVAQLIGRPFEEVQQAVYHQELLLPFELGRISAQEYYEGLKKSLKLPWPYERFVTAWNDIFRENADVTRILQRLAHRHRLVALTNTNELHLAHLRTTIPALSVIRDWVASCEVGACKPDPEIYFAALKRSGMLPRQAVYVDDRPEMVEGGRSLGITAVRFENSRQLEQDLQAIGLNL